MIASFIFLATCSPLARLLITYVIVKRAWLLILNEYVQSYSNLQIKAFFHTGRDHRLGRAEIRPIIVIVRINYAALHPRCTQTRRSARRCFYQGIEAKDVPFQIYRVSQKRNIFDKARNNLLFNWKYSIRFRKDTHKLRFWNLVFCDLRYVHL